MEFNFLTPEVQVKTEYIEDGNGNQSPKLKTFKTCKEITFLNSFNLN